ncbi:WXG100 family type VII secretion target [Natronoglycomyces albus]|uniref:WXG100 family type VII secretion target n=1 Tax=Natronoglycomyces albus TaxID=2811108 RepID=A0A895XTS1_9ACTN|nr:WXG100 family type VII secretion target [Natronoglycomyces albus]QSB05038.1 WXG100 family type VII secretion target [Natronoglycomyces albus]
MGETDEEFTADSHEGLETQDGPDALSYKGGCGEGDCTNGHNASEDAWIALMSAVPVQFQDIRPKNDGNIALPSVSELREIVNHVRPDNPSLHAIERIAEAWQEQVYEQLEDTPNALKSKLKALAGGWEGTDFDAFEQACTKTANMIEEILEDVQEAHTHLTNKKETLYALQGGDSGEVPYPPPQFWTHKKWGGMNSTIHIRPAFWDGHCETKKCNQAREALKLAGIDEEKAEEVETYRQTREDVYFQRYTTEEEHPTRDPFTRQDAREMAQIDADQTATETVAESMSDYDARATTIREDITERKQMANEEIQSISLPSDRKQPPIDTDPDDMNLGGMTPGAPGGMGSPSAGPASTLSPPSNQTAVSPSPPPEAPTTPEALASTPGSNPGEIGGPGGSGGGNPNWALPADPDNEGGTISDGLYAGAPPATAPAGLGTGPGVGTGAAPGGGGMGVGAGAGAGMGPARSAAGAGGAGLSSARGGGGAGAGAGRGGAGMGQGMGAGGRGGAGSGAGRMGGGGSMMGGAGGRGAGTGEDEEKEGNNWLVEDDDVWGINNPDFEQYA